MGKPTKSVLEKFQTKLSKLSKVGLIIEDTQVKIRNKILFRYSRNKITYTNRRYFPSLKDDIKVEDYTVTILLDHQTLKIITDNFYNPPRGAKKVLDMVRNIKPEVNSVTIGGIENKIEENKLFITYEFYSTLNSINQEEGKDKVVRVRNRVAPFLQNTLGLDTSEYDLDRDYSLLLKEVIASNQLTQEDIVKLTNDLNFGEMNEIVIERQINKQAQWLLNSLQIIIDEPELNKVKSQNLGKDLFNFAKTTISGPEDLMEKVLTKYGQNIIFGVPALLNVDGFVTSSSGLPKSQFDLLLVTNLSDIEIVELKRPDEYLLEYDDQRSKFYMSKSLGTAAAQSERYISAIYRENDDELKIHGQSIRAYLQSKVGGTITLSIVRPKALIVIGSIHRIAKPYSELPGKIKAKVTRTSYEKNLDHAYKELKASFKNIDIITYSELIESARLRLQIEKDPQ